MEQDDDKKREVLKWARKSEAADKVRQMEKEYDEQVEQFRKIIVEDKKMIKRRKQERVIGALEKCKEHGGPFTRQDVERVKELKDESIVLAEAKYLKLTVSPD